jgi:hypothetical protein
LGEPAGGWARWNWGIRMGRVNLEERLFSEARIGVMARAIGYPAHCAIGMVAYLWHDSQELGVSEASAQDIADWCRLDEFQSFEFGAEMESTTIENLITGLVRGRFIEQIDGDLYLIRGNQKHVDNLNSLRENAVKGGEARAKAAKREGGRFVIAPPDGTTATSQPTSQSAGDPPAQFNAIQINAIQITDEAEISPAAPSDPVQEIIERRKLGADVLKVNLRKFPDREWLVNELITWDSEADEQPEFGDRMGPSTRFRKFVEKHWEQRQARRSQAEQALRVGGGSASSAQPTSGDFEKLKKETEFAEANPPDPEAVRRMLRQVTGGGP